MERDGLIDALAVHGAVQVKGPGGVFRLRFGDRLRALAAVGQADVFLDEGEALLLLLDGLSEGLEGGVEGAEGLCDVVER